MNFFAKTGFFAVFFLLGIASLSALGMQEQVGGTVTVYTHRHYDADQKLYDDFTAKTGIKIQVLKGDADQLLERIRAEGSSSPADVFITADVGRLYRAKELGLLKSIKSQELESAIPAHLRDPQGFWFGLTKRARVIVYDKSKTTNPTVKNYEDLASPSLGKNVVVRSSSNVYNISLLGGLLGHWGKEKTLEWAKGIAANLARAPQGGDRDQMKAIAAGNGTYAVTNTYYIGQLLASKDSGEQEIGARMGIIFPNQDGFGTHINVSGAGLVKTAPNAAAAQKFLEYLVSPDAQKIFASENFEYPVRPGIESSKIVASWGSFKEDTQSLEVLGKNSPEALKIADEAGWK